MAGGLVALFDDVAVLARAAAASVDDIGLAAGRASAKAAGVVVDDAAVTPQYVRGLAAERELPIIRRIAVGSLRNKLLILLPAVLLLSEFLPDLLTPILMLGGIYLCYEGAEKVWAKLAGHDDHAAGEAELPDEDTVVSGAVRTDFILSAEIMAIALATVADATLLNRAIVLAIVSVGITAGVYGVVALIVKLDDIGLHLSQRRAALTQAIGRGLVRGVPVLMRLLSAVGTAAMIWVGGGIIVHGLETFGITGPAHIIHDISDHAGALVAPVAGAVAWIVGATLSGVVGLVIGGVIVAAVHAIQSARGKHA